MIRRVKEIYNLPEEILFCKKCTVSNQRPRITFNSQQICSACTFREAKDFKINWQEREKELVELCNKHRSNSGNYDVIVPCSGGKDGSYVAHLLKNKYNMNPLCVTWAPLRPTQLGKKNLQAFIDSGFNSLVGTADPIISSKLTWESFKEVGDPFQPFIYGQANFPLKIAVSFGISLIMYGENGEVEYGGDMKNSEKPTRDVHDHEKHYFSGMPPEFWFDKGFTQKDLSPYMQPEYASILENQTEIHFMSYYTKWDPQSNYYYCKKNTGFTPKDSRSVGTYSRYASLDDEIDDLHYYLGFIKFGIGRCTSDTAHEIRDGLIDREEGSMLVKQFDGEYPSKCIDEFCSFTNRTKREVDEVIEEWRSDHIWEKKGDTWKLKNAIWHEY